MRNLSQSKIRKRKKRPRIIQKIYAYISGYFWRPCPICGEMFGGHESDTSLMDNWHSGRMVCYECSDEANKRNDMMIKDIRQGAALDAVVSIDDLGEK